MSFLQALAPLEVYGTPLPIEIFGGLVTDIAASDLPQGASPNCQDVIFPPVSVKSRPGLASQFTAFTGNPTVNYLRTFTDQNESDHLLMLDSLGVLREEFPVGGAISTVGNIIPSSPLYCKSDTLFGREFQAFSDGKIGAAIPLQYDGTKLERVTRDGPGQAPTPMDFLPAAVTIAASTSTTATITSATTSGLVSYWQYIGGDPRQKTSYIHVQYYSQIVYTASTTLPAQFVVGAIVSVSGNSNANFNFTNLSIAAVTSTTFTVNLQLSTAQTGTGGTASVGGATMQRSGNVLTVNTGAVAHGFQAGWTVVISGTANLAIGGSITSISQQSGVVTVVTSSAHGLVVGADIAISGTTNYNGNQTVATIVSSTSFTYDTITSAAAEVAGTVSTIFNGTYVIASTPSLTSFTVTSLGPNVTSTSAGTATVQGNVGAGLHQVSMYFVTDQGTSTKPAPPISFYAAGGKLLSLTNLAIGDSGVMQRVITITATINSPATEGTFFHTASMVISDNTTTSAIIDFSDAVLIAGESDELLFEQEVLSECAGMTGYADRLFTWGERNKIQNFVNATFGGGYAPFSGAVDATNGSSAITFSSGFLNPGFVAGSTWVGATISINGVFYVIQSVNDSMNMVLTTNFVGTTGTYAATVYSPSGTAPLGWTFTSALGGAAAVASPFLAGTLCARINNGFSISQSAFQDVFNAPILSASTGYSLRALAMSDVATNITFTLSSVTTGFSSTVTIAVGTVNDVISGAFSLQTPSAIPPDLLLSISVAGTPSASVYIAELEIFPSATPYIDAMRGSFAANPEAFDGVTGLIETSPSDGQRMTAAFSLLDGKLYILKEKSMYWTEDDGQNEPALWKVTQVSDKVGTPSIQGAAVAEGWAVIASREGAYIFWGGQPLKISQEIQPEWDTINWNAGHTLYTVIDTENKRIHIGAPTGSATSPNKEFVMDYRGLITPEEISQMWSVHYSSYSGKILTIGDARKWTVWNLTTNSAELVERADGTLHLFRGNGAGNGKVYDQIDAESYLSVTGQQYSDDGAAIDAFYDTYFAPSHQEEAMLRVGSNIKLFPYLSGRIRGAGFAYFWAVTPDTVAHIIRIKNQNLSPLFDEEFQMNIQSPRLSWRVESKDVGAWFQLTKLVPYMQQSPTAQFRGT